MNSLSQGLDDCSEQHSSTVLPGLAAFVLSVERLRSIECAGEPRLSAMHSQSLEGHNFQAFDD
jgi:hypothetical protein